VTAGVEGAAEPLRYRRPTIPVIGAHYDVEWKEGAERRLAFLAAAPFGPPEKAYGHSPTDQPGYAIATFGRGRTAWIPWTVGSAYRELGITALRGVFVDLVEELLDGCETVSAELPEQVELTVHRTGDDIVVHLINQTGARRRTFGPHVPIRGGRLRIGGMPPSAVARSLVNDSNCEVVHEGDSLVVALPELGLYHVILISNGANSRLLHVGSMETDV
jgi:hypothetical protein